MTRVLTVKDYLLEELNRRARARGEDVELVFQLPPPTQPQLATRDGNVVEFNRAPSATVEK
jgi:hypothetical protein